MINILLNCLYEKTITLIFEKLDITGNFSNTLLITQLPVRQN